MSSGLVGLQMKDMLPGESFAIPRNWLVLGGAVPAGSARPQMSKHRKHMVTIPEPWTRADLGVVLHALRVPGQDEHRMMLGPPAPNVLLSRSHWVYTKGILNPLASPHHCGSQPGSSLPPLSSGQL